MDTWAVLVYLFFGLIGFGLIALAMMFLGAGALLEEEAMAKAETGES